MEVEPLWLWLSERARAPDEGPRVHLAWGADDKLAGTFRVFSEAFDERVVVGKGGHDWETFGALFREVSRSVEWTSAPES
jgi:hypothetical protein